ncbi:MAG: hypothetical protein ACFE9S_04255 [Candidatus Hermodarchaeota archaeon]
MSKILLRLILFLLAVIFYILIILNSTMCAGLNCPRDVSNAFKISVFYNAFYILLLIFLWKERNKE